MSRWPLITLGEVCTVNPRLKSDDKPGADTQVSFVPMAAVNETEGRIADRQVRLYRDVAKGYTAFRDGDVLFAKITPCMENGKAAIAGNLVNGLGFGSTEFHVLRPGERLCADYLFHFVRQAEFRRHAKANFTGTAGQQRVPKTFIEAANIPLPPISEQRRTVDILNRADGIRRLRRQTQEKARQIIPALFIEMFGDPEAATDMALMGNLVREFRYGTSRRSAADGKPVLRIPNVVGNVIDATDLKTVPLPDAEYQRLRLEDGDLLFVRTNGNPDYVGRCAVFDQASVANSGHPASEFVYASYLIRGRLDRSKVEPRYLQTLLTTGHGRRALRERSRTSAGQYNINIAGLSSVPVPLPPLDLQHAFAERVADIQAMIVQQDRMAEASEEMTKALMAQAFAA